MHRITVSAGADRRKRDRLKPLAGRQCEASPIGARKELRLAHAPVPPDRTNGMNHMPHRKVTGATDDSGSRRAAIRIKSPRLLHDGRTARAMNGAIDTAAARKMRVRRIDDRV